MGKPLTAAHKHKISLALKGKKRRGGKRKAKGKAKGKGKIRVSSAMITRLKKGTKADNIRRANSGKESKEFVEAARRFYPGKIGKSKAGGAKKKRAPSKKGGRADKAGRPFGHPDYGSDPGYDKEGNKYKKAPTIKRRQTVVK